MAAHRGNTMARVTEVLERASTTTTEAMLQKCLLHIGWSCHLYGRSVSSKTDHILRAEHGEEVPWPTKGCLYSTYEVD